MLLIVVGSMHAGNGFGVVAAADGIVEEFVLPEMLAGCLQVATMHSEFGEFAVSITLAIDITKLKKFVIANESRILFP